MNTNTLLNYFSTESTIKNKKDEIRGRGDSEVKSNDGEATNEEKKVRIIFLNHKFCNIYRITIFCMTG